MIFDVKIKKQLRPKLTWEGKNVEWGGYIRAVCTVEDIKKEQIIHRLDVIAVYDTRKLLLFLGR